MKTKFTFLLVSFFLLSMNFLFSQDFLVEVPSTDQYSGYINPLKRGATHQFQIKVKNQTSKTYSVTLLKSQMGEVMDWITIDPETISISAGQTINFLLTVKIPGEAQDRDYQLPLYFDAKEGGTNNPFNYFTQKIIVDASNPEIPQFSVQSKSKELYVYGWNSFDARSVAYTNINPSTGFQGIKEYTVTANNTPITYSATGTSNHTFKNLTSNTYYQIQLKATDLAGNSSVSSKNVSTGPDALTGLSFINTTYVGTTLKWNASDGATGYNIYQITTTNTHVKLNSNPITGTSFTINNANPSTSYTYYGIAINAAGSTSDKSADLVVITNPVPSIIGSSTICTGSTNIYSIQAAPGHTVVWSKSSNLGMSASGNSATCTVNGYMSAWLAAKIISNDGRVFDPSAKTIWLGKPVIESDFPIAYWPDGGYNPVCNLKDYSTHMELGGANNLTWTRLSAYPSTLTWVQIGNDIKFYFYRENQTSIFRATTSNTCGTTIHDFAFKSVNCGDPCQPTYLIAPNPATDQSQIIINIPAPCDPVQFQSASLNGYVAIYDNQGVLKRKVNYNTYGNIELDLAGLKNGLYHIQIFDGNTIQSKTMLIQK